MEACVVQNDAKQNEYEMCAHIVQQVGARMGEPRRVAGRAEKEDCRALSSGSAQQTKKV